jgi:hypothetical protein
MTEHTITKIVPTDVSTILLFHPDEMEHTAGWPVGWYSTEPAWRAETAAGRLVAWGTGYDGAFKVRLTTGDMTARERAFTRQSWDFGYTVRLGRVFLDNSDTLPGESRMTDPDENPDYWFALANGDYTVKVSAVEWNAEPGSDAEGFETLPNYVVQFLPRGIAPPPPLARRPPDLTGGAGDIASDEIHPYTPSPRYAARDEIDLSQMFPAAVCTGVRETGGNFASQGEADFELAILGPGEHDRSFDMFDVSYVLGDVIATGEIAQLCRMHGCGGAAGMAQEYKFKSLGPVRIVSVEAPYGAAPAPDIARGGLLGRIFGNAKSAPAPSHRVLGVRIAAEHGASDEADGIDTAAYRAEIISALVDGQPLARALGGVANYEALFVAEMTTPAALSAFLLAHLSMTSRERLALELAPGSVRATTLRARLAAL